MMDAGFSLKGFDETKRMLEQLPDRIEKRILQQATMAGAREIAKTVRQHAPRHEGQQSPASQKYGPLHKNIKVSRLKRTKRGEKGARVHTGNAFWGLILEIGSRYIPAMPWFAPAFNQGGEAGLAKAAEVMEKRIPIEAEKLAKETGAI